MSLAQYLAADGNLISSTNPLPVASSPANLRGNPLFDATGRARSSEPYTTFDSNFISRQQTSRWTSATTGGATVAYAQPSVTLTTVTSTASSATWQTRKYHSYQPGKTLLVYCTGAFATTIIAAGTTCEIGYFDDNNGIFFRLSSAAGLQVVLRNGGVDTVVSQSSFNGPDATTVINPTSRQFFFFELTWLGSGAASAGVIIERKMHYLHQFFNSNTGSSSPYMQRGSLPVRYRIVNSGADVARTMVASCVCVQSEGGYHPVGQVFAYARTALTNLPSANTEVALMAVRISSTTPRVALNPLRISIASTDSTLVANYRVVRLIAPSSAQLTTVYGGVAPTFTTLATATAYIDCAAEVSVSASAGANGQVAYTGVPHQVIFATTGTGGVSQVDQLISQVLMTADIAGVTDVMLITGRRLYGTGNSQAVSLAMQWQELE